MRKIFDGENNSLLTYTSDLPQNANSFHQTQNILETYEQAGILHLEIV